MRKARWFADLFKVDQTDNDPIHVAHRSLVEEHNKRVEEAEARAAEEGKGSGKVSDIDIMQSGSSPLGSRGHPSYWSTGNPSDDDTDSTSTPHRRTTPWQCWPMSCGKSAGSRSSRWGRTRTIGGPRSSFCSTSPTSGAQHSKICVYGRVQIRSNALQMPLTINHILYDK